MTARSSPSRMPKTPEPDRRRHRTAPSRRRRARRPGWPHPSSRRPARASSSPAARAARCRRSRSGAGQTRPDDDDHLVRRHLDDGSRRCSATAAPRSNGPSRLKQAAIRAAGSGRAARVATSVAIALAASCRPFVKANAMATQTARTNAASTPTPARYGPTGESARDLGRAAVRGRWFRVGMGWGKASQPSASVQGTWPASCSITDSPDTRRNADS